jgi:hypothetical protein
MTEEKLLSSLQDKRFHEKLFGKLFADKGYISQDLFERLFVDTIRLITKNPQEYEKCADAHLG